MLKQTGEESSPHAAPLYVLFKPAFYITHKPAFQMTHKAANFSATFSCYQAGQSSAQQTHGSSPNPCSMPLSGCVRCGQPAKSTCLTKACNQALHSPGTQPHACTVRQLTASKSKATPATIQSLFKWQHTIMQHPHSFTQHPQTAAAAAAAMPTASCCSRLLHSTPMGSQPHSPTQHQHQQTAAAAQPCQPPAAAAGCCTTYQWQQSSQALHSTSTSKLLLLPSHAGHQLLQQVTDTYQWQQTSQPYTAPAPAPANCCCCPAMLVSSFAKLAVATMSAPNLRCSRERALIKACIAT